MIFYTFIMLALLAAAAIVKLMCLAYKYLNPTDDDTDIGTV